MPDREVAARLAGLRRAGVDLERRLRADELAADDSEAYWHAQIDDWRGSVEAELTHYPFQLRALQHPVYADRDATWDQNALTELVELRGRVDAIILRISPED